MGLCGSALKLLGRHLSQLLSHLRRPYECNGSAPSDHDTHFVALDWL